jgi:hypothetical protein
VGLNKAGPWAQVRPQRGPPKTKMLSFRLGNRNPKQMLITTYAKYTKDKLERIIQLSKRLDYHMPIR